MSQCLRGKDSRMDVIGMLNDADTGRVMAEQ